MAARWVHVYVFDSLADWEPGYAIAGINNPAFQRQPGRYRVQTVGLTRQPVTTIGGLRILPDLTLDQLDPKDSAMLILPGGELWDAGGNTEVVEKAIECLWAGVPVAAICGATAGLARGGVLDDRQHTSNAPEYLLATGYAGAAFYQAGEAAVTDREVITASAMAPLEFAYHIFKRLDLYTGPALEAWYGLFRTREMSSFTSLLESAGQDGVMVENAAG
jgi:putative intracellular protease/amidase